MLFHPVIGGIQNNNRVGGFVGNNEGTDSAVRRFRRQHNVSEYGMTEGFVEGIRVRSVAFSSASVFRLQGSWRFVGGAEDGAVTDCHAAGTVNGNNEAAGFAGMLSSPAVLTNVYASVDVAASAGTGGPLVGGKASLLIRWAP